MGSLKVGYFTQIPNHIFLRLCEEAPECISLYIWMVGNVFEKINDRDWEEEVEPGRFRGAVDCGRGICNTTIADELTLDKETVRSRLAKLVELDFLERHHISKWDPYKYWVAESFKDTSRLEALRPVKVPSYAEERAAKKKWETEPMVCDYCKEAVPANQKRTHYCIPKGDAQAAEAKADKAEEAARAKAEVKSKTVIAPPPPAPAPPVVLKPAAPASQAKTVISQLFRCSYCDTDQVDARHIRICANETERLKREKEEEHKLHCHESGLMQKPTGYVGEDGNFYPYDESEENVSDDNDDDDDCNFSKELD